MISNFESFVRHTLLSDHWLNQPSILAEKSWGQGPNADRKNKMLIRFINNEILAAETRLETTNKYMLKSLKFNTEHFFS